MAALPRSRAGTLVLGGLLILATAGAPGCGRGLQQTAADDTITVRVRTALATDPSTSTLAIQVETLAGDVTLTGEVRSAADEAAAVRVARQVDGVRSVRSLLRIGLV